MSNSLLFKFFLLSFTALFFATSTSASHIENAQGDLSGDLNNPTTLSFVIGANNNVAGTVGNNGNTGATNGSDADYFSFSLADNVSLTEINIVSGSVPSQSFFGYSEGIGFSGQGADDIDGFVLFNAGSGNVISALIGDSVTGGDHSFWVQETSDLIQDYEINFVFETTEVPLPGAALFFISAIGALRLSKKRS